MYETHYVELDIDNSSATTISLDTKENVTNTFTKLEIHSKSKIDGTDVTEVVTGAYYPVVGSVVSTADTQYNYIDDYAINKVYLIDDSENKVGELIAAKLQTGTVGYTSDDILVIKTDNPGVDLSNIVVYYTDTNNVEYYQSKETSGTYSDTDGGIVCNDCTKAEFEGYDYVTDLYIYNASHGLEVHVTVTV